MRSRIAQLCVLCFQHDPAYLSPSNPSPLALDPTLPPPAPSPSTDRTRRLHPPRVPSPLAFPPPPGALLRKATATREHEEAVRQRLEQLDAEQHSVRMEREQFDRDRQRFESEMSELRDKYTKERQAFEAQMALVRARVTPTPPGIGGRGM